jgi:hypothetical protein
MQIPESSGKPRIGCRIGTAAKKSARERANSMQIRPGGEVGAGFEFAGARECSILSLLGPADTISE